MNQYPSHSDNIIPLKRIEGQVRGIQRMIEEGKYCVDIMIQIRAVMSALMRVEDKILERHFNHCVRAAIHGSSAAERKKKTGELFRLISRFKKI